MHTYGDVCCGDCEHYTDEGCEEAAEALALEGWPRVQVLPDDSADASRCPEFSPGGSYQLGLEEEQSAREAQARITAIKNFSSW